MPAVHTVIQLFLALALGSHNSHSLLCSLVPFPTVRPEVYFIGTALIDTVRAGRGEVVPQTQDGQSTSAQKSDVFGQVIRLDLLNSDAPIELRDALQLSRHEVVLVPWGYNSMCQPAYWSQSARFAEPGREGLYSVRPRPRRLWVGGRPTFDAFFADFTPYPHAAAYRSRYAGLSGGSDRESLTAREHFSLYAALPTSGELTRSPATAYARLLEWELQNPDLASRYPANQLIAYAKSR